MRVGLLECDHVDERNRPVAGDYRDMFAAMLAVPLPHAELVAYDACAGQLPASPAECDAWLCSGSRWSVYEERPWIDEVSAFVRGLRDAGAPFVGVCFGHQLLAHALGGRVERAAAGWAAGAHRLDVVRPEPWMRPALASPNLLFMHQDQVTRLPDGAEVLACTVHCQVAMFRVGESMVGIQAHPEFGAPYVAALLDQRVARIGEERTAAARRSLAEPIDGGVVAAWIAAVLQGRP
jgi:GMP synthase-like glutamine amidotransferase